MNYLSLVFIKPIVNRIKYMKVNDWVYVFVFLVLILSPSFLFRLNKSDTFYMPTFNIDIISNLILFFFSIVIYGVAKPNYKKVSSLILPEYMILFKLVPSRYKILLWISQLKRLMNSLIVCSILVLVYLLMSAEKIAVIMKLIVLVSSILIFIQSSCIVFPALISFKVTTKRRSCILKIISILMMLMSAVLYFIEYKYTMIYLPNYILASGFHAILTRNADNALYFAMILMIFTCVIVAILLMTKYKSIVPANIYEASLYQTKLQNRVSNNYIGFTQMFPFLGKKMKLIASKETLQFLNEYNNLITILFNTTLLIIIALIGKNAVPFPIEKSILFSSIGYLSFYVGLTSIARDINNAWIYKIAYPRWINIAIAKYASSLINAILTFIFFLPALLLAVLITKNSLIDFLEKGLHWSIILVPFSAISLGMLTSTILPVKLEGSNEKVRYSYSGIEGVFYLIVVLLVVSPALIIENSDIFYTTVIFFFNLILTIYSIYRISKKLDLVYSLF